MLNFAHSIIGTFPQSKTYALISIGLDFISFGVILNLKAWNYFRPDALNKFEFCNIGLINVSKFIDMSKFQSFAESCLYT